MKPQLNEEQVLLIEKKLEELGLNYAPLQNEILDHFCCLTEDEMENGHGNYIIVQHDETYKTKYSHLSKLKVKVGETIKKGKVIGLVGSSGMSTAPHLHYEVIKNGKKVNPKDYYTP